VNSGTGKFEVNARRLEVTVPKCFQAMCSRSKDQ